MTKAEPVTPPRLPWKLPVLLFVVMVVVFVVVFALQGMTMSARAGEDIHFNHQKHVSAGAQCVFCHPGVLNGPVAGLPSVEKCTGCHRSVEVESRKGQADVEKLMQYWEEGRSLRWVKRFDQPDFVFFNHRAHVTNGVNCESCHGNVGEMVSVYPVYRLNMGFCLNCHRQQAPEKQERLVDCVTCHK